MPSPVFAYPLFAVACILSSALLLCVLTTSFIRQRWNPGVFFLCFWLFWGNLTYGVNGVLWSDNADVKAFIYCDIVTRLQIIVNVVKPMATLIIVRRLYKIAHVRSVDPRNRRVDLLVECTLGLILPALIAGPLYYINEGARFQVLGGFGCASVQYPSILPILTISLYTIVPPLLSVVLYYPRMILVFYRQYREINEFLQSNDSSITRTNYIRILALASIDVLVTLPLGAISLALFLIPATRNDGDIEASNITFYPGWHFLHTNWGPTGSTYDEIKAAGNLRLQQLYFSYWTGPLLAFVIFGLFGLTPDARATYGQLVGALMRFLRMRSTGSLQAPVSSSPLNFRVNHQVCNIELHGIGGTSTTSRDDIVVDVVLTMDHRDEEMECNIAVERVDVPCVTSNSDADGALER
ncbi:unnamed protein product, partial [Peniophora sp. CBMAI 1063]